MLHLAGVDPKTIQYILGHADIGTTMNRYTHMSMAVVHDAGKRLYQQQKGGTASSLPHEGSE